MAGISKLRERADVFRQILNTEYTEEDGGHGEFRARIARHSVVREQPFDPPLAGPAIVCGQFRARRGLWRFCRCR